MPVPADCRRSQRRGPRGPAVPGLATATVGHVCRVFLWAVGFFAGMAGDSGRTVQPLYCINTNVNRTEIGANDCQKCVVAFCFYPAGRAGASSKPKRDCDCALMPLWGPTRCPIKHVALGGLLKTMCGFTWLWWFL
jgi:hypothetical protein